MDPPLSPPAARTRAKAARATSPTVTPPHRSATPRATSQATHTDVNVNFYDTLRAQDDDDNSDDDNPFRLDSEELLTPPAAIAGGVAAVDEVVDRGAPPGATFATAAAGFDATVDGDDIPATSAGFDATIDDDDISA